MAHRDGHHHPTADQATADQDGEPKTRLSRRSFIGGATGAAAIGLAACSGDDESSIITESASETPGKTPTTTAVPGSTTTTTVPASSGASAAPAFEPATEVETWSDPWIWRPTDNPEDILSLYVVENFTTIALNTTRLGGAGIAVPGNPLLFSWNGLTPGPTIRMKGTDTLRLKVYNQLGPDLGTTPVKANPSVGAGPYPGQEGPWIKNDLSSGEDIYDPAGGPCKIPAEVREDYCLGEHVNGVHSVHVTNIHTHGLHVKPGRNDNGTYSDDIYLRIIPRADAKRGIEEFGSFEAYLTACFPNEEVVDGEASYQFVLGGTDQVPVHPPGTHWYHPHSHGATHHQVAGGMAGFLIVEGDVDEAVNTALALDPAPDPEVPTGPWEYRERTVLIQRITVAAADPDAPPGVTPKAPLGGKAQTFPVVNGTFEPGIIVMSPGAVERWRLLNGSVDGSGNFRVAVVKGQFVINGNGELEDPTGGILVDTDYQRVTLDGSDEELKAPIWQLSHDGITLVNSDGEYYIRDLNGSDDFDDIDSLTDCYRPENLVKCYNRANEVRLTNGNRADLFFQAPLLTSGQETQVYTLLGLPTALHGNPTKPIVAGYIIVRGTPVDNASAAAPFSSIALPEVPDYLRPVHAAELKFPGRSDFATRTIRYAGWGSNPYPEVIVPDEFISSNPELAKLIYYEAPSSLDCGDGRTQSNPKQWWPNEGEPLPTLVIPPTTRTMSIDGKKFDPTSTDTPRLALNTVEEWAVFNDSVECYAPTQPKRPKDPNDKAAMDTFVADMEAAKEAGTLSQIYYTYDEDSTPQPYFPGHQNVVPFQPGQVPADWSKVTSAIDHPFHIHQNPFWLLRIDVPDGDGNYVNVLPEPRWGDTQYIPRNAGRIVFRSRFLDYSGEFVNHCHILLHEDNGMMQRVQILPAGGTGDANWRPNFVPGPLPSEDNPSPPDLNAAYQQSAKFVDNTPTGQVFPGFTVPAPQSYD